MFSIEKNTRTHITIIVLLVTIGTLFLAYRARRFDIIYPNPLTTELEINKPLVCYEEPNVGPCEAVVKKYFYNSETEKCESFIYGGCDGHVPFGDLIECQRVCE